MTMHYPTIENFFIATKSNKVVDLKPIFNGNVTFKPTIYWNEEQRKEVVARILSHVSSVFKNLDYKRVLCNGSEYFLEFSCNIGYLDATRVLSL